MRGGLTNKAPDGKFLGVPVWHEEALSMAVVDPNRTLEESIALDVSGQNSRPDIFQPTIKETRH